MKQTNTLRQQVWDLFTTSTPGQMRDFRAASIVAERQEATGVSIAAEQPVITHFSEFNEQHLAVAKELWTTMFRIANDAGKQDREAVDDAIAYLKASSQNPELMNYALMIFITHNERAKRLLHGTIPSLTAREPQKVIPSLGQAFMAGAPVPEAFTKGGTTDPDEDKLNYFREDPAFNEHHEHWHVVYPNGGIPYTDPGAGGDISYRERDRHGEMFVYMHQQMIAHYDANRFACGLDKVEPYDFSTKVVVGYNPGSFVQQFGDSRYSSRPSDWTIVSIPGVMNVAQHRLFLERLHAVVKNGFIELDHKKIRITADLLGLLVESLGRDVEKFSEVKKFYGNVHNQGHNLLSNAPAKGTPSGVMSQTATAVRDPVFFRWHKHIDDYSYTWQNTQRPESFSDGPDVQVRSAFDHSPDIIICELGSLAEIGLNTGLTNMQIGEMAFGGTNWNADFTSAVARIKATDGRQYTFSTLNEIQNYLKDAQMIVRNLANPETSYNFPYQYLNHKQYGFFIRLENLLPVRSKVTVRMFIVPEQEAENRRAWIELDKFVHELEPFSRAVIFRKDTDAAVVRKPAIVDPEAYNNAVRPLALTDIESLLASDTMGFIGALKAMMAETSGNPDTPSLPDYYKVFRDSLQPASTTDDKTAAAAAFKGILDKYLNNLGYAWQEFSILPYSGLQKEFEDTATAYTMATHAQTLGAPDIYFQTVMQFIRNLVTLLTTAAPTLGPQLDEARLRALQKISDTAYCECGLPYGLLYPKGTKAGMPYLLMVMITDWSKDITSEQSCCGSMSYCGTKGIYPDIREMGYPFHRPFKNGVLATFAGMGNTACRTFTMKMIDQTL